MMNTKKREFGLIIIFLFLAISIQAAVLRGSVTDKVTNEPLIGAVIQISGTTRSEERRVGKECRSRWSPYH